MNGIKERFVKKNNIDIFIDDEPVHLNQAREQGIDVIIYSTKYNNYCNDFNCINNWNDIYLYVQDKIKTYGWFRP